MGAHHYEWDATRRQSFIFAQIYHFAAASGLMYAGSRGKARWAPGALLLAGTLLFSGTVYHRCFTGERHYAHRLAPAGGVCLMAGFLVLAAL